MNTCLKIAFYRQLQARMQFLGADHVEFVERMFLRAGREECKEKLSYYFNVPIHLDGIGLVPTVLTDQSYADVLREAVELCERSLYSLNYYIQIDCDLDDDHYRRVSEKGVDVCRYESSDPGVHSVLFDLGGHLVGRSTSDIRQNVVEYPNGITILLEPGYTLYLITQWLTYVQRRQALPKTRGRKSALDIAIRQPLPTMFVECAGVEYSSDGNSKFNDVPCWDIYPPCGDAKGLILLNWNCARRSHPVRGVAFVLNVPVS